MNYKNARNYISALSPRGIQPGLTNISRLCEMLGNPQNGLNFIHIAGTNGKGSTGAFIASILNAAGMSAGRFVSPAVGDYLESFTFDGKPVSRELYTQCAMEVKVAAEQLERESVFPTSFEAETAIAFLIFKKLSPDYVLLECGMGGRLDSTNIIASPYASVITSISLDHQRFLGNTLSEIADEKCGIIKDSCPVITAAQSDEVMEVIAENAMRHGSPLFIADDTELLSLNKNLSVFSFEGKKYTITLNGTYQIHNAAVAIKTAQCLGISSKSIREGLKNAKWEYRFERVGKYILDGAHNEDAARELVKSIKAYLENQRTAFICGCFKDKAYSGIARITAPYADAVYCVTPPTERGLDSKILCSAFKENGAMAYSAESMARALDMADSSDCDAIVIFGSLSILRDAKHLIHERDTKNAKMQ